MNRHLVGSLFLLISSLLPSRAQTASVLVDFGGGGVQSPSPDPSGKCWNNVTEGNVASVLPSLTTETGLTSGISLAVSGYEGVNANGSTVPDPLGIGALAVPNATSDSFFVSGNNVLTVTLGNLPPDGSFRLTLFGSRDIEESRTTRYDVIGLTASTRVLATSGTGLGASPQPNANRSQAALVENVTPASDGTIAIQVRRDSNSFGYLGALRLEIMTAVNFPPSAVDVVALGSPRVGTLVQSRYRFQDPEGDAESGSSYVWQRSTLPGATGVDVSGPASGIASYQLGAEDAGYYYRCAVIPGAATGRTSGQRAYSPWYGPVRPASSLACYHIGNSFTRWTNIPKQLSNLSVAEERPSLPGIQLTDGQSLRYHWDTGIRGANGPAFGTRSRDELATQSWDVLILQPFSQEWQNYMVQDFYAYARKYYQLADASGTQVYLYAYWPWQSLPIEAQTTINTTFEQVRTTMSQGGAKPALIIPAGQALRAVIEACGTGALAGYNRSSFYMDERHPSALGGYVSALTHYATIYKKSPVGLPPSALSSDATSQPFTVPSAVATRIQQIVWNTVGTYPNSGVAIFLEPPPPPPPPPVYVTHPATVDPAVIAFAFGPSTDGVNVPKENLPHAVTVAAPGQLGLEYSINPAAEAVQTTYTPEWSSDLIRWTATQPTGFVQTRSGQKVTLSWPRGDGAQFVRVYVVKPGP
ncbi:MAG: hypothetical protein CFE32_12855 [Alphaproteobacteria bacterium PA3]|nr:MAG: hypothetical protein CFE32_12855 [Alphaproteobacteria bacterium PA3]